MTPRVARAVAAVRLALDRQHRSERRLIGRWALPGGNTIHVKRIDPTTRLALVGNGAACWNIPVGQLLALLDAGRLRYLGR